VEDERSNQNQAMKVLSEK
jgi:serine/threonine protein kinase